MNAFHDALEVLKSRIRATETAATTRAVFSAVTNELEIDQESDVHHESHSFMRYGRGGIEAVRERLHTRLIETVGEHEAILERMLEETDTPLYEAMTTALQRFRRVVRLLMDSDSDSDSSSDSE
jgi:hypothetical protein